MVTVFNVGDRVVLAPNVCGGANPPSSIGQLKGVFGTIEGVDDGYWQVQFDSLKKGAIWGLMDGEMEHAEGPW